MPRPSTKPNSTNGTTASTCRPSPACPGCCAPGAIAALERPSAMLRSTISPIPRCLVRRRGRARAARPGPSGCGRISATSCASTAAATAARNRVFTARARSARNCSPRQPRESAGESVHPRGHGRVGCASFETRPFGALLRMTNDVATTPYRHPEEPAQRASRRTHDAWSETPFGGSRAAKNWRGGGVRAYPRGRLPKGAAMTPPETRYAKSGNVSIAYQVTGSGDFDLVFLPGFVSNLDQIWENPNWAHFFSRLAGFSRLILFDKRGTGLSDRVAGIPDLEARMDDIRAVMDAVGSERAALLGVSEGGAMSMLFAATYPDRTRALALYGTYAHYLTWVTSGATLEAFIDVIERGWGTGATVEYFMPSKASDGTYRRDWARWERAGASPSAAVALTRMNAEIDVRPILPTIRVPTLVLHRIGDPRVNVEAGRYLGNHIPSATYVELPGEDH